MLDTRANYRDLLEQSDELLKAAKARVAVEAAKRPASPDELNTKVEQTQAAANEAKADLSSVLTDRAAKRKDKVAMVIAMARLASRLTA